MIGVRVGLEAGQSAEEIGRSDVSLFSAKLDWVSVGEVSLALSGSTSAERVSLAPFARSLASSPMASSIFKGMFASGGRRPGSAGIQQPSCDRN